LKLGLILSNDWELYGTGAGDFFEDQQKPLQSLQVAAMDQGAKITVMAELGQQWAIRKLVSESWAQEISSAWEESLRKIIRDGFDVQFHLHPQWLDAEYKNQTWKLNYSKWAVSSLNEDEMLRIFIDGKNYLESLLKPVRNDYECIGFRAGAFCIEPSAIPIKNLKIAGFLCDSSVVKGFRHYGYYDYSNAYSNYMPWYTSVDDIKKNDLEEKGMLEMPVASINIKDSPLLRKLNKGHLIHSFNFGVKGDKKDYNWLIANQRFIMSKYPPTKQPKLAKGKGFMSFKKKLKQIGSKFLISNHIMLDYDNLPPIVFCEILKQIYEFESRTNNSDYVLPIMAIGHTKLMHNPDNFKRILELLNRELKDKLIYITLSDAVALLKNKNQ